LSLELGVSVREIEEDMSIAEFKEYQMYLAENPTHQTVSEIQNAQLMLIVSSYMGGKQKVDNFILSARLKAKNAMNKAKDIASATADDINKMLGL
jgi:hypothetical protein